MGKTAETKSASEGNWALNQRMINSPARGWPATAWFPRRSGVEILNGCMNEWMDEWTHACMDAWMYVPLSMNFYASLCFSAHLYAYLFSSVRTFAYLWVHVNVHIWHLCGCVSACACSYLWISERISAYLCVSVCIRVYPCVCACLHCVSKSLSNWHSERWRKALGIPSLLASGGIEWRRTPLMLSITNLPQQKGRTTKFETRSS